MFVGVNNDIFFVTARKQPGRRLFFQYNNNNTESTIILPSSPALHSHQVSQRLLQSLLYVGTNLPH